MKIFFFRALLSAILLGFFSKTSTQNFDYQDTVTMKTLLSPVDFTPTGFEKFVRYAFNQAEYAGDFLPNNFTHLIHFLDHGKQCNQPRSYAQHVLRLFSNKLKGSTYVNARAFASVLKELPSLLEPYFIIQKSKQRHVLLDNLNSLLYNTFLEKFSHFKRSPELFFDDLSQDILEALCVCEDSRDISMDELRKTLLVFLEVGLSKLVWSPDDSIDTWHSAKMIADLLAEFMDYNLISDPDDLNDLYITLIERYCFFVDIASSELPDSFYQAIQEDITDSQLVLLTLAEQDTALESKKARLTRAVSSAEKSKRTMNLSRFIEGDVAAKAYEHGILIK